MTVQPDRKDRYEAPALRELGSVHSLTQGSISGNKFDGFLVLVEYSGGGGTVNGS